MHAQSGPAPLCDSGCGGEPDPTAPAAVAARASMNAARGTGSTIVATTPVLSATVNVEGSQSFTYSAPVVHFPGRQMNVGLNLYYNSFIWTSDGTNIQLNADHDSPSVGFRLDYGFIELASDWSAGLLTESTGAKHPLAFVSNTSGNFLFASTDSSYIQVQVTSGSPWMIATFKNGLTVYYQGYGSNPNMDYRPWKIEDTNGNIILIGYVNNSNLRISYVGDTLQRQESFIYDSTGTMLQCIVNAASCDDPNGVAYKFKWAPITLNFNFSESTGTLQSGSTMNVLTDLVYPNGAGVHFIYGDWGIVTEVQELSAGGQERSHVKYNFSPVSAGQLSRNPAYTQEEIFDGVNTGVWNYSVNRDPNTQIVTLFAVTDPCGTTRTTTFDANKGLATQIQITSSNSPSSVPACSGTPGATWRTVNQSWTADANGNNARLASTTTILEDQAQTQSKTVFRSYDANGNPTDVLRYDFGAGAPGALLQEIITSYASLGNHILDRPADVQVKDGSGKLVYHKKFNYDEVPVKPLNPAPVFHDETNYSASGTLARGNLTSATVFDPPNGTSGLTSRFTYDEAGNMLTVDLGSSTHQQWNFSTNNQYAYPDSVSIGPAGNQLTTSFTYDWFGNVISSTDPNGQQTTMVYDALNRPYTTTTPDGVTARVSYDDASASPAVTVSRSFNNQNLGPGTKAILDGRGRTLSTQVLNNGSPVSTKSMSYNILGELLQSSNPYGVNETPLYTIYNYDALERPIATTPPALSGVSSQNPYKTDYSGTTVTVTDPALKQRRQYGDALGRLVRVDEPGVLGAASASGSLTVAGSEQSVPSSSSSNGATAGTATVTIAGAERSTQVLAHAATTASITVTIGGTDARNAQCVARCTFSWDTGTIRFTAVVGGTTVGPVSASYDGGATSANLATALYNAFPANSAITMSNPNGGASFTLTSIATGSAMNNSTLSTAIVSDCVDTDTVSCAHPGWTMTLSGPNLSPTTAASANFSGGSDNVWNTIYDTGNVTVSITANGTAYQKVAVYGQTSTPSSIANDLYNQFVADAGFNQVARVNPPGMGAALQFTTIATGANTNYPLNITAATTSSNFASGSTSFTVTPSGSSNFTSGQNGTLYDSGTVTLTLAGFTSGAVPSKQVTYGQGSTAQSIAGLLAAAVHNDPLFPVDAVVPAGSATITFTARSTGADANSYSVSISGGSSLSASFANPSFPNSPASSAAITAAFSGGADGSPSLDPSVALSTYYSYDPLGNLLQITQGQQTRNYVYDGLGRVTSATTPETGNQAVKYTYTDFGAIATRIDARTLPGTSTAITTTYSYDPLNRLQSISYNDGTPGASYTYNAPGSANNTGGRLATITVGPSANPVESESYQYDVLGRVTRCAKIIGGNPYSIGYSYNIDGTVAGMTYPSGRTVSYSYDGIGRLTQIGSNGSSMFNVTAYNAAGELLGANYGNQMQAAYTYNNQLQLASLSYGSTGPSVLSLSYSYGGAQNNGQIQGVTDNLTASQSTAYTYDELGRLKTAQTTNLISANTWKLKYTYDRYGNRLSQVPVAGTATMPMSEVSVDPATNHLLGNGYLYDAAGNMVSDGLNNYGFDAENRMVSTAPVPGLPGNSESFAYGVSGLRINKNGTLYIYSAGRPIAEYASGAAAASPNIEYLYAGGSLLASISGGTTTYAYADHLSNRSFANSSGGQTATLTPFPFGEQAVQTGTPGKWLFTTYERDNASGESGLDYADARFYSSRLGRFMSMDPLAGSIAVPQSLNRYTYVQNNPVNFSDPFGMELRGNLRCLLDNQGNCEAGTGSDGTCMLDGFSMDCGLTSGLSSMGGTVDCSVNLCGLTAVSGPDGNFIGFVTPSYGMDDSISYGFSFAVSSNGVRLTSAALAEMIGLPGKASSGGNALLAPPATQQKYWEEYKAWLKTTKDPCNYDCWILLHKDKTLATAGATMNDARTWAIWTGGSIVGAFLLHAGLTVEAAAYLESMGIPISDIVEAIDNILRGLSIPR